MNWALVNADGSLGTERFDVEPTPGPGQRTTIVPGYYPARAYWSPLNGGGFVDVLDEAPLLSVSQFILLFTKGEWFAIKQHRAADLNIDYFWTLMEGATSGIRLSHPMVADGVNYLVSVGLIDAARGAAVLAGNSPT